MSLILFIIFLIIVDLGCIFALFFFISVFLIPVLSPHHVPYIRTRNIASESIKNALHLSPESILYDLGCGDGKVLFDCAEYMPKAHYIGIENNWFPYLQARIHQFFMPESSHMKFILGSFLKKDISDATHIYIFLSPKVMDLLLPKFERELQKGARIVSCDFKFTHRVPTEIMEISGSKSGLYKRLCIYDF